MNTFYCFFLKLVSICEYPFDLEVSKCSRWVISRRERVNTGQGSGSQAPLRPPPFLTNPKLPLKKARVFFFYFPWVELYRLHSSTIIEIYFLYTIYKSDSLMSCRYILPTSNKYNFNQSIPSTGQVHATSPSRFNLLSFTQKGGRC